MKTAINLSVFVLILSAFASALGLLYPGLYQDNSFVQMAWFGNDFVTLIIIVPALSMALLLYEKGSLKAQLVWMGILGYLFYNYAFYLFGAAFNAVFLLYAAIFSMSLFALIFGLATLPVPQIHCSSKSVRWISIYLVLIALMLIIIEISTAVNFIFTGQIPEIMALTEHSTSVVHALDLSLVVPFLILTSVLLWKEKQWGYILGVIMLVKAAGYGLVLVVSTMLTTSVNFDRDPLLPFYVFVALGGICGLWWLLKNVHSTDSPDLSFLKRAGFFEQSSFVSKNKSKRLIRNLK